MGLFDNLFKKEPAKNYSNTDIVAIGTGRRVPLEKVPDPMFAEEMMGQTLAFDLTDGEVVSPANGVVQVLFPTGHAFGIAMEDGTGLLVHIGIDTVNMKGEGFKTFIKVGDKVKAGQKCVKVDLKAVANAGYSPYTMMIVTEKPENVDRIPFKDFDVVTKGEILNK